MEFIVSSRSHWAQWLWIQSLNKHEDQREREREFGVFGLRRSGMEAERGGGVLEKSWTEGKGGSLLIWLSIMGKNKHRNVSNSFPVTNGNGYCLATATHGLCLFFFFFFFGLFGNWQFGIAEMPYLFNVPEDWWASLGELCEAPLWPNK